MKFLPHVLLVTIGLYLPGAEAAQLYPEVLQAMVTLEPEERVAVIIRFRDRVDLKAISRQPRSSRRIELLRSLQLKTEVAQTQVRQLLDTAKIGDARRLWIINALAAKIPVKLIALLAARPEIESITLDALIVPASGVSAATALPEWNLSAVGAEAFWEMGFTGEGVVIGIMDSGVDGLHPDLGTRWRGGANSWFDPFGEHVIPHDVSGHGTQVAGILVGGDAGGTAIGVAPGAHWIAARIYDNAGVGTLSALHAAFQWMLDPDNDPETDDAPDIVNNSWNLQGTLNSCNTEFQADIDLLRMADIAVVFSSGNSGPNSATSLSPANNSGSFEVGAVDASLNIGNFSGRGPSACDGAIYPQVSAPGVNVRTADLTFGGVIPDSYVTVTGTSFAASHVSGVLALLKSAATSATVEQLESALTGSAQDVGVAGADHEYGWGVVNAVAAYQHLVAANIAPVAVDDYATTVRRRSVRINLLTNDTDVDGTLDPASISIVTAPHRGSVVINGNGRVTYASWLNRSGSDFFTYTMNDNHGALSNEAVVTVDITRR